jgi:serine/threonine protein kinase
MDSTESVGSLPRAFGRYRVEKVLGEGAMGVVYLARDSKLDRQVALKVPKFDDDPEMMERFLREARSAATLLHRNICRAVYHDNLKIHARVLATGHASPDGFWYDQEEHEWVVGYESLAEVRSGNDLY